MIFPLLQGLGNSQRLYLKWINRFCNIYNITWKIDFLRRPSKSITNCLDKTERLSFLGGAHHFYICLQCFSVSSAIYAISDPSNLIDPDWMSMSLRGKKITIIENWQSIDQESFSCGPLCHVWSNPAHLRPFWLPSGTPPSKGATCHRFSRCCDPTLSIECGGTSWKITVFRDENPSSGPWFPHDCHICLQVEFFLPLETEDAVHVAMDFAWILIFIRFKPAFHHDFLKKK